MAANPDGKANNYDDLSLIIEVNPSLSEYTNVDEWIEGWESTAETQQGLVMQIGCTSTFDSAIKLAASAFVATATAATLF